MTSWSERMISHTGTEIRPRLLREAAVRNIAQWGATLMQQCRVSEESVNLCKALLIGTKCKVSSLI